MKIPGVEQYPSQSSPDNELLHAATRGDSEECRRTLSELLQEFARLMLSLLRRRNDAGRNPTHSSGPLLGGG
jgi:hypothetical protein